MKFNSLGIAMLSLLIYLSGCTTLSFDDDNELKSLVAALIEHDKAKKNEQSKRHEKEIKVLTVKKKSASQFIVTADLEKASISEVVSRIFKISGQSHQFDEVKTYGNITANFKNLPLLEALNLILKPNLLVAEQPGDTIVINNDVEKSEAFLEVTLENINVSTAVGLLNSIYGGDGSMTSVKHGIIPYSNTIYLKGTKNEVSKISQFLLKVDNEIPHVFIEVLVVEFETGELRKLGAKLEEWQHGKYGLGNLNYGNSSDIIGFSKLTTPEGGYANFLTSFRASVNILVNSNKARLISRPYISTLSGKTANVKITNVRYILGLNAKGGIVKTPIEAGVTLKITPLVLGDNKLNMTVNVEDSQFSDINLNNVSQEVRKNQASTIMQVDNGQTIIIGGLVSNRRSWGNFGFPGLRDIPILNLFFAEQRKNIIEKEVMIYVTPHIWKPNMVSPMIAPDAFKHKK